MTEKDYTAFTEANLAEFVETCKKYHALKDALYGWLYPGKVSEVLRDAADIERVARLANAGVSYETDTNGNVWAKCDVAGVEFVALRSRGNKNGEQQG